MIDPRLHSSAVARNRDAILEVLRGILPTRGLVLEIGSGSGEHTTHFAAALPRLTFQPSDIDLNARASIDAWIARKRLQNVHAAVAVDATRPPRPVCWADAILCIDMLHVAPWAATEGLFYQSYDLLQPGGVLYLYGPFLSEGVGTARRNLDFDARLRAQNPEWGLRDLAAITAAARANDFSEPDIVEMPGDKLSVTFRRI
jgi:SAM-dependent methyltransferase